MPIVNPPGSDAVSGAPNVIGIITFVTNISKPFVKSPNAVSALADSIRRFDKWLRNVGYESNDPYDIWGTTYGVAARRIYYRHSRLGAPLIAPVLLGDILFPG